MTAVEESGQLVRVSQLDDKSIQVLDDPNAEQPKVAIALDTGRPPFDHISARRAVALATDRKAMVAKVFDGQGSVAKGIFSDTSPWFGESPDPSRDLDGAKQQVAEYQKETGQPLAFTLLVPPDTEIAHVASLWRVQLTEAGIDVTLSPVDPGQIALATLTGQYQAALEVGFSSPHPDLYEPQFRGIPAEQPVVNPNITRYVNPLVTKAFADARSTSDVAQQVDAYRIVQEQLLVDVPWLFLVQRPAGGHRPARRPGRHLVDDRGRTAGARPRRGDRLAGPDLARPLSGGSPSAAPRRVVGPWVGSGHERASTSAPTSCRPPKAFRVEHDSLGEVRVPADARYGAQTQRAVENFPISGGASTAG